MIDKNIRSLSLVLCLGLSGYCGSWHPLDGNAEDFGRLFLDAVDIGDLATAYLVTSPEFRREKNYYQFMLSVQMLHLETGLARKRRGAVKTVNDDFFSWQARTETQADTRAFSEILATSKRGVYEYKTTLRTADNFQEPDFDRCKSESCELLHGKIKNLLSAANGNTVTLGPLVFRRIDTTPYSESPLARDFIQALRERDRHTLQSLAAFEVPQELLKVPVHNLRYYGYATLSDPEISRYFGTLYYYQGTAKMYGRDLPMAVILNSNTERLDRISGCDFFSISFNSHNSFLIADKKILGEQERSADKKPR